MEEKSNPENENEIKTPTLKKDDITPKEEVDNPIEETTEEVTEEVPKEDYKTKFQYSSGEAQKMRGHLIDNGIDPKTGKPVAPAEPEGVRNNVNLENNQNNEELGKDIVGFEFLSDEEKATVIAAKSKGEDIKILTGMVKKLIDKDKFASDLSQLVAKTEFSSLAGNSEFRAFAYKKENLNTSLEVLARSYLFKKPEDTPTPKVEGKNDRVGLEDAGGHDPLPPSDKGVISTDQIAHIRKSDPKRYMRLVKEGKIRSNLK